MLIDMNFETGLIIVVVIVFALQWIANKRGNKTLQNGVYKAFPLVTKTMLTKDTAIYRFGLPNANDVLGLPIGQHISVKATISSDNEKGQERTVVRSYTPISLDQDAKGYFDLLVKSYAKGTISRLFGEMNIGDKITITGPQGFYDYKRNCRDVIGMVAGGTGITPMYQIIKAIYQDIQDTTQVFLIFASCCEEELFLKNEIDRMVQERPGQFHTYYMVETTDREDWEGGIGYVTREVMNEHLPSPSEKTQLLICGPPRMVSSTRRNAIAMGYVKGSRISKMDDQIFVF
ncbi:NADH-cytochrome b5 reductase [Monosporozyma unispora]|nr:NADH-cytochrome b5 reductase [Kazachstania unispora]